MIFKRALRQELNFTTGVVSMVLVTIVLTNLMIRVLGNAASGTANPKDALVLIALGMVNYLPILLTASIFIAILMVLTRWYKDSEMIIWQAAGVSLFGILKSILIFTLPFIVLISALSLIIAPWANDQTETIKQRFQQRDDVSMLLPGQFKESKGNNRIFFIEKINTQNNTFENIFVTDFGKDRQLVAVSKQGYIENKITGEKFLILENGRRYEGTPGSTDFRITEFKSYTLKISDQAIDTLIKGPKGVSTWNLIKLIQASNGKEVFWFLGELLWRTGLPIMAIALSIIAIPLSYTNPRLGRQYSLILAILIFFTYSNLLKLTEAWVQSEKLSFTTGVWLLHVLAIILGIFFIYLRENNSITFLNRVRLWLNIKTKREINVA